MNPETYYVIPVAPSHYLKLSGSFPLTPAEWRRMLGILATFRPGLVEEANAQALQEVGE